MTDGGAHTTARLKSAPLWPPDPTEAGRDGLIHPDPAMIALMTRRLACPPGAGGAAT